MTELEEVGRTADAIRAELETAFVRGLATSTPKDRRALGLHAEEWERIGANHVAARLRTALSAADRDAKDAPRQFLAAYTSLHSFERVLSVEAARRAWQGFLAAHEARGAAADGAVAADQGPASVAQPPAVAIDDPKGALGLLDELAQIVENLVRTGLTAATPATRVKLEASFKEASRRKLLRLGASLRYVNEEIGRFLADDGSFAVRRYAFFLHRSWLLAKGTRLGLSKKDDRLVASLSAGMAAAPKPVGTIEVVTLGVNKRASAVMCSFEFRLRVTRSPKATFDGKSLIYSVVYARKPGVPAEAYLHLPQPQKFAPKIFRDKTVLEVTDAAVIPDARAGRLVLGAKSTVMQGSAFDRWSDCASWDPQAIAARALAQVPTPLDLAIEAQEEVVLEQWELSAGAGGSGTGANGGESAWIQAPGLLLSVGLAPGEDGAEARKKLEKVAKKKKNRPPLFGTVHAEFGRLVFAPLSALTDDGPEHLMLSDENVNLAALVGSLDIAG
jgi:hypothetical protein